MVRTSSMAVIALPDAVTIASGIVPFGKTDIPVVNAGAHDEPLSRYT